MRLATFTALAVAAALLAACGDDSSQPAQEAPATGAEQAAGSAKQGAAAQKPPEKPGEVVEVRGSEYGPIMVDSADRTLYLFDNETSETSECYGACAEAWPPFVTDGEPQAGKDADRRLLGTTKRDDGSTQVTYGGHPLYYYVDEPAGEVLCHNVDEFGGLWLVVTPEGSAVQ